jgi:hypothetical protein
MKIVFRELGISTEKLKQVPKITELLKHNRMGGIHVVLAAMRFSTDPLIEHFLERWDELPPEFQQIVPWEALAQRSQIDVRRLLGAIVLALREHSATQVKLAALMAHPDVTEATVRVAMLPDARGYRDRQMIHQALGFLAPPKGQTINFNFAKPEDDSEREVPAEDIDMNQLFPDLVTTQRKLLPE